MASVIVGHPDSGFSGYLRAAGRGLFFSGGFTEPVDLTAAQETELTSTGFTVDGQPDPPVPDPFPQYLTEDKAATAIAAGTGPVAEELRAAFGSHGGTILPPASAYLLGAGASAWFGANFSVGARFIVRHRTTFSNVKAPCGVASGNIEVAIHSCVRTGPAAFDVVKVGGTGVIPCPTPASGSITPAFATPITLEPGEYIVTLWCDNTTATFVHGLSNTLMQAGGAISHSSTSTNGTPAAATAGYSGRTWLCTVEEAIPVRPAAVLLGDSITQNQTWFTVGNALGGSQYALGYNAGVPGQTIAQIRARVAADVIARNPGLTVVLAGTNNISAVAGDNSADILAEYGPMLDQILAETSGPVILGTIPPRMATDTSTPLNTAQAAALNTVNTWIRGRAGGRVKVADWTVQLSTGDGVTPNLTYFSDHVHPNPAGQQIMATVLAPLL